MQFNELVKEIKSVVFETVRMDTKDYFEAVLVNNELTKLTESLEKFFGPPAWPSEKPLSSQVKNVIKDFGGIMPNQKLYFWSEGKDIVFTMLWPWNDEEHTTIKVIKK